jgi:type II secretory pathway component HofQ
MRKTGNVLWIAPKDEIDERVKKDFEAAQTIQKLEPLRTQAFQLNYAKAVDMVHRSRRQVPYRQHDQPFFVRARARQSQSHVPTKFS